MFGLKVSTNIDNESQFLLFDAITAYSKSLTGSISKHPIATGGKISSSFTSENPVISLTGVISVADFSNTTLYRDEDDKLADNVHEAPNAVVVRENSTGLLSLIPASISQFLPDSNAEVSMDSMRQDYKGFVDQILETLMSGEKYDQATGKYKNALRTNALYEFNEVGMIQNITQDLVLTNYSVKEDESTGDCIICDLTFERAKFVKLRTSALPKDVVDGLKKKSAIKQNKGTINSKPVTKELDEKDDLNGVLKPKAQSTTQFYSR